MMTLKERYKVIRVFATKYREELTDFQLFFIDKIGVFDRDEYEEFINSVTNEEFVGNLFTTIGQESEVKKMKEVLDGDVSIKKYIKRQKKMLS